MKMTKMAIRLTAALFFVAILTACGTQQADTQFESIAPARLLALQSALAVVQVDMNLDLHPNPLADDAYFTQIEPDVVTLHRAAREVGDIEKDVKKATGVTSAKYAGMDDTLTQIAALADELVNYFEHPSETSKPAFLRVQKSLNALTDAFEKSMDLYLSIGGPGIPTHQAPASDTPSFTATP